MTLENFKNVEITEEELNLFFDKKQITYEEFKSLPPVSEYDVIFTASPIETISSHDGVLSLEICDEAFIDDDNRWIDDTKYFILTPKF
jgi:hypothetical protein